MAFCPADSVAGVSIHQKSWFSACAIIPAFRFMKRLFIVLEMIKFEHTVFAIPFAFLGAFLAARGFPGWRPTLWIVLAMFGARSAAMGFNRLVDADLDSRNPRTSNRALPRRLLTSRFVLLFVILRAILFFLSRLESEPAGSASVASGSLYRSVPIAIPSASLPCRTCFSDFRSRSLRSEAG